MYDQITEDENEEIWKRETPDDNEAGRLDGKSVLATAKRVCDFINKPKDLIEISSFGERRK